MIPGLLLQPGQDAMLLVADLPPSMVDPLAHPAWSGLARCWIPHLLEEDPRLLALVPLLVRALQLHLVAVLADVVDQLLELGGHIPTEHVEAPLLDRRRAVLLFVEVHLQEVLGLS